MTTVRLLANGMVGQGFSGRGFTIGLARDPQMVGCDAGTADFGASLLGSARPYERGSRSLGRRSKVRAGVERDLRLMLTGARELDVPLVIGSCGGAGGDPHLETYFEIVSEIAKEANLNFRLAMIHAEQPAQRIIDALKAGRVRPLGPLPQLTDDDINSSSRIVAMMGAEPIRNALKEGAQVVLAGRCTDPAIFASVALEHGLPPGLVWHAAKSIDKGPLATNSLTSGSPVLATINEEFFDVEPMNPDVSCTVRSVSSVTLHENPNPWLIDGPSGAIDTRLARYQQLDARKVRVSGSAYVPAAPSVKLEGARLAGYRSIVIAGVRDPRLLRRIDDFLTMFREQLERVVTRLGIMADTYDVQFRTYGIDGVMGKWEPKREVAKEIGLIIDVVANDEDTSYAVASRAGPLGARLHLSSETSGGANFAYPFSPSTIRVGPVYEWSIWHLLDVTDEMDPFETEFVEL